MEQTAPAVATLAPRQPAERRGRSHRWRSWRSAALPDPLLTRGTASTAHSAAHRRLAEHPSASVAPVADIIIPNWNGQQLLAPVLDSLRAQTRQDFLVTLIDNGSSDASVEFVRANYPEVTVIENGTNLGFAKAVNKAVAATSAPFVVLLNNDVEVQPEWLAELLQPLERDPKLGYTTSKMRRYHDRQRLDEAGQDVSIYGVMVPRGFDELDSGQFDQETETLIATGGASAYRRTLFDQLGGLDEGYFFYYEDADFCLRARWLGWHGRYVPTAVVYHYGGGSAGRVSEFTRINITRNLLITILKDFPLRTLVLGSPKLLFHQLRLLQHARRERWLGSYGKGYLKYLAAIPSTLLKRRRVMGSRQMSTTEFLKSFRRDYPLPTKFKRT